MRKFCRRSFLKASLASAAGVVLHDLGMARQALPQGLSQSTGEGKDDDRFVFAQIQYRGGEWDPNPLAHKALLEEVMARTSVETLPERKILTLSSKEIFSFPFLYMAGRDAFQPFTDEEQENLRLFLESGGVLFAENSAGYEGTGFDESFRTEIRRVLNGRGLQRLPSDHTVFRSFYLIQQVGGRRIVHPYLEGVGIGDVTPVIYCENDLGGAWEKDPAGNWVNTCEPGGEAQRREAFKLGVNLVLYVLTANYKQDKIHLPFIKRRVG